MQFKESRAQDGRTWEESKVVGLHSLSHISAGQKPPGEWHFGCLSCMASPNCFEKCIKPTKKKKNEHNSHLANKRGRREFSLLFVRAKNAVNVNHLCSLCKICPFPIKVRCPDWSMLLMLSPIQCLPCVQTLQLAGCKLKNNALCFYTSFTENLFFFFSFWAFVGN